MGHHNFSHYSNNLHRWDRKVTAITEWPIYGCRIWDAWAPSMRSLEAVWVDLLLYFWWPRSLCAGTDGILGCPVVDHLTIITRIDNIGKLYGQRLTYLHNLQGGYCMQNYIKPQSRKKYRRNSDFYNSWSTCHPTWRRVRWSISTAHARISREKSFCINYDNYV